MIGISAYAEEITHGRWTEQASFVPRTYSKALCRAGALTVLLVPDAPAGPDATDRLIERIDGIVLTGGDDVCGLVYGREETEDEHSTELHSPERDRFEMALAQAAARRSLPLLAICRGLQVLNVAMGGTLVADLEVAGASREHRAVPGQFTDHEVSVSAGSRLHDLIGDLAAVPSHHHQALDRVADGLTVSARAADGVVEAAESAAADWFALGVQWHPEAGRDSALFDGLVHACGGVPSAR